MIAGSLVSIIIPCYNAELYIKETLKSVLHQSYQNFEIFIINDGSTDKVEIQIKNFSDDRICYIKKQNSGVSDTRNVGLKLAKGDYVLFLDADDILSTDFLKTRLEILNNNPAFDFCCGNVFKIDEASNQLPGIFRGTYNNVFAEILLYNPLVITCPSNYIIRKSTLDLNNIYFKTELSSTADRFFLIELAAVGRGGFVKEGGALLYRVSEGSMSHKLSNLLVDDNAVFYNLISEKQFIPPDVFKKFSYRINYILGAAYVNLKSFKKGIYYLSRSFFLNPKEFLNTIVKKLT